MRISDWSSDVCSSDLRVGGGIDVEADNVAQLLDEHRIVRELELPHAVRPQAVRAPDALDRADADPDLARHHRRGPVGRLDGGIGQGQRDAALGYAIGEASCRDRECKYV